MTLKKNLKIQRKKKAEREKVKNFEKEVLKIDEIMNRLYETDIAVYDDMVFQMENGEISNYSMLKIRIVEVRNKIQKYYEKMDTHIQYTETIIILIKLFAILDFANMNSIPFETALDLFPKIEIIDIDEDEIIQLYRSLQKQSKNIHDQNFLIKIIDSMHMKRNHIVFYEALAVQLKNGSNIDIDEIIRAYQILQKVKQQKDEDAPEQRYLVVQPTFKPYDNKRYVIKRNIGSLAGYLKFKSEKLEIGSN